MTKKESVAKQKKEKKAKGEKNPRTGAKANKEALEEIKTKLDDCVVKEDFEKATSDVARCLASVTVFKTQMKIFEKKFMSDRAFEASVSGNHNLLNNSD